jgi:hypothetical protein
MVTFSEVAPGAGEKVATMLLGISLNVPDAAGVADQVSGPVRPVSFVVISIDAPFLIAEGADAVKAIASDGGGAGES